MTKVGTRRELLSTRLLLAFDGQPVLSAEPLRISALEQEPVIQKNIAQRLAELDNWFTKKRTGD
ncbi:MAG: hypothetical protein H6617_11025 [Bdellovibrionaceae bacterium]|nr:hypothetical protein [Bdellovibrionales bacterium]MCB9255204.1 hypothetical protein [Pseudobdellovibrionaceae bacterium]